MNGNWTDKLIDAHLEAQNTAEPSLGFESRMLTRLAEERSARRRPLAGNSKAPRWRGKSFPTRCTTA